MCAGCDAGLPGSVPAGDALTRGVAPHYPPHLPLTPPPHRPSLPRRLCRLPTEHAAPAPPDGRRVLRRKQKELEELERERKREEKLRRREQKQRDRASRRSQRKLEKLQAQGQRRLQEKIRTEERRLLLAQRNLQSVRLVAGLLSRAKVPRRPAGATRPLPALAPGHAMPPPGGPQGSRVVRVRRRRPVARSVGVASGPATRRPGPAGPLVPETGPGRAHRGSLGPVALLRLVTHRPPVPGQWRGMGGQGPSPASGGTEGA